MNVFNSLGARQGRSPGSFFTSVIGLAVCPLERSLGAQLQMRICNEKGCGLPRLPASVRASFLGDRRCQVSWIKSQGEEGSKIKIKMSLHKELALLTIKADLRQSDNCTLNSNLFYMPNPSSNQYRQWLV